MAANAFASELSYQVLQKRRRESELTTPQANERSGLTHLLLVQRPVARLWDAGEPQLLDPREAAISRMDGK